MLKNMRPLNWKKGKLLYFLSNTIYDIVHFRASTELQLKHRTAEYKTLYESVTTKTREKDKDLR